jgi:hypothetical protein
VWHITHRCHKREFLLKFARDQRRRLFWLFEAKQRFFAEIKARLGVKGFRRRIEPQEAGGFVLKEESESYSGDFDSQNDRLSQNTSCFGDDFLADSRG